MIIEILFMISISADNTVRQLEYLFEYHKSPQDVNIHFA